MLKGEAREFAFLSILQSADIRALIGWMANHSTFKKTAQKKVNLTTPSDPITPFIMQSNTTRG